MDYVHLLNDPTIIRYTPDGKATPYLPFKPSLPSAFPFQPNARPSVAVSQSPDKSTASASSRPGVFIPVSPAVSAQVTPGRRLSQAAAQSPPPIKVAPAPVPTPQREGVTAKSSSFPLPVTQPLTNNGARGAINIPYVVKTDTIATSGSTTSPTKESLLELAKSQGHPTLQVNGSNPSQPLVNGHTSSPSSSTTAFQTAVTTPTGEFKLKLPPVRQPPKPSSTVVASRTSLPIQRPPSVMSGNAKMN